MRFNYFNTFMKMLTQLLSYRVTWLKNVKKDHREGHVEWEQSRETL